MEFGLLPGCLVFHRAPALTQLPVATGTIAAGKSPPPPAFSVPACKGFCLAVERSNHESSFSAAPPTNYDAPEVNGISRRVLYLFIFPSTFLLLIAPGIDFFFCLPSPPPAQEAAHPFSSFFRHLARVFPYSQGGERQERSCCLISFGHLSTPLIPPLQTPRSCASSFFPFFASSLAPPATTR